MTNPADTANVKTDFRIAVIPGDGIGTEIMDAALTVLDACQGSGAGFRLHLDPIDAGAGHFERTGIDMAAGGFAATGDADAILLGAIGLPHIRHADGTEIAPHLRLRTDFGLYAGMRPVKMFANIPTPLADPRARDIDLVIVRESTEGLFASVGKGIVDGDDEARDTLVITRHVCERLFDAAFTLARQRKAQGGKGLVTCVDKANVFVSMAFFRKIFHERAVRFPDVEADTRYVDACALDLVRKPWEFDVLVMENMFGDILSDLGAGIVGGMGMAPCAELGDEHGLFQPAHGSAPDIAGQGIANPTAMLLSAAMMLDWLGNRHGNEACVEGAKRIAAAVSAVFAGGLLPAEFGGGTTTEAITAAVIERLGD